MQYYSRLTKGVQVKQRIQNLIITLIIIIVVTVMILVKHYITEKFAPRLTEGIYVNENQTKLEGINNERNIVRGRN